MNELPPRGPLDAHLRHVARDLAAQLPPGDLRDRIQRAVHLSEAKPRPWWQPALAWGGVATAAVALFAAVLVFSVTAEEGAPLAASGFVPVASSERWREAVARGSAWLVAAELPQARLAALGLPYDPARADESVRAQLLLHSSGDVLAVRVIRLKEMP
ncbi:MAG: hypothetical protein HY854_21405 [Burkholderiales bacterium]|nr:hypothetical protein [Burkholderiales bacterium]